MIESLKNLEKAAYECSSNAKKYYVLEQWHDKNDAYWLARLQQEVGELASSLVGDHDDPPEHELRQIASIAMNWLALRAERNKTTGF